MTRIGLIARAEDRGLGIQTWEFFRALQPRTLVLDVGETPGQGPHFDRYPGARIVKFRGLLPETKVARFLEDVDVVYTAETAYHPSLPKLAKRMGVELICHINPEFYRDIDRAGRWWAPTDWRLDQLPAGTEVVPVPVAMDRFTPVELHDGPPRWLHVAGRPALADRNGTNAVLAAIPHLRNRCSLTIATQSPEAFDIPTNPLVDVRIVRSVPNYWDIYTDHDLLVMPRRFGGLCLPVQEAMAAGLGVVMTDVSPNPATWPVATVRCQPGHRETMPAGRIRVADVAGRDVASVMDRLANPAARHPLQAAARAWAADHSWDVWADRYRDLMAAKVAA